MATVDDERAMTNDEPRLYGELASWFHLLTPPEEYADEASVYRRLLVGGTGRPVRSVLELGSGGGNNASHLKAHFEMTLVDRSPGMLALSRAINPECEHVVGDMRTVRLGREFDAVFVHDAVDYMTNEGDLRAAIETAYIHCAPDGVAVFVPDHLRETFQPGVEHGGQDGRSRALRYLQWTWDPDPSDDTYIVDFAYLLREQDGTVRAEHDRHICGLFARRRWLELLEGTGFRAEVQVHDLGEERSHELFVARKPE
jgi:SAM-dependent methyltransferase